jgi:alkylation response protein AidB-like acyl-CoA dehydrogenase
MERSTSPFEQAFRSEVRSWLAANAPDEPCPALSHDGAEQGGFMRAWQKRLFEAGWAGIAWPREYGGRGLSQGEQVIWYEEYARAGAPAAPCLFVGLQHAGPVLMLCGSEAQKAFHLPRILRGEDIWCQGFSEPGAGSDLANIRTRGDVDGDHIVVNGSKIWTSFAQMADYQELIVRTEPGSTRHQGLSWLICNMKSPGITVRPIESMDGEHHNCEVFYDNVRIPLANVVGGLGAGWATSMATLAFERGTAFVDMQLRLSITIEKLIALAASLKDPEGRPLAEDAAIALQLGALRGHGAALRSMTYMSASRGAREAVPGPEGVYVALMLTELQQRVWRCAMELLGPAALERPQRLSIEDEVHQYLFSHAATIGGGTSEIRRNIIGERILKLPRHA